MAGGACKEKGFVTLGQIILAVLFLAQVVLLLVICRAAGREDCGVITPREIRKQNGKDWKSELEQREKEARLHKQV